MSIHRHGHEDFSLFLAAPKLQRAARRDLRRARAHRDRVGGPAGDHQPSRRRAAADDRGGLIRVADALDMAKGRSRIPFERGRVSMHSLSAAAIEDVTITDGEERPILIEIRMNNSSGLYQVDGLLKAKLKGIRARALCRGRRAHRHRDRAPARASCTGSKSDRLQLAFQPLRDRLTVGRRSLEPEVGVRIPVPQLRRPGHYRKASQCEAR